MPNVNKRAILEANLLSGVYLCIVNVIFNSTLVRSSHYPLLFEVNSYPISFHIKFLFIYYVANVPFSSLCTHSYLKYKFYILNFYIICSPYYHKMVDHI